jgi:dipeptidyl aminopeptidase/acylaminoacyl peptidase
LTTAAAADTAPAWSPDGERIAFVSKRGADQANALYIIRHDGGEAERIVELPYAILTPKWLPDSKHVGEQQPMVRIEPKPAELVQRSRPRTVSSQHVRRNQNASGHRQRLSGK